MKSLSTGLLLLWIAVVAGGCAHLARRNQIRTPNADAKSYDAPDGRTWVLYHLEKTSDVDWLIMFVPSPAAPGAWTEMLSFSVRSKGPSKEVAEEALRTVVTLDDPKFEYAVGDLGGGSYSIRYATVRWKEAGTQKTIKTDNGYLTVSYQARLGAENAARVDWWEKVFAPASIVFSENSNKNDNGA